MVNNWSGYQLWKKCDKQAVMEKTIFLGFTSVGIYEIGDLLKCKK